MPSQAIDWIHSNPFQRQEVAGGTNLLCTPAFNVNWHIFGPKVPPSTMGHEQKMNLTSVSIVGALLIDWGWACCKSPRLPSRVLLVALLCIPSTAFESRMWLAMALIATTSDF